MKEFIEKLIGRLGELKEIEKNRADSCDEEGYGDGEQIYDDGRSQGRFEQSQKIIQIVNELAEEYENDFCEWKYIDSTSYNATIPCRGNTMNIKSMRYYTYCPYCGKKIKVVE